MPNEDPTQTGASEGNDNANAPQQQKAFPDPSNLPPTHSQATSVDNADPNPDTPPRS
jgi:hypothetical protein